MRLAPTVLATATVVLGLCLWWLARHRRRRLRLGPPDRVVRFAGPEAADGLYVYTVSNTLDRPALHRLAASVRRAGGALRVVYLPHTPIGRLPVGYGAKIVRLVEALEPHAPDDLVCFLDAFDVLVVGDLAGMVAAYRRLVAGRPPTLVFGAEPWCWPTDAPYESYCPAAEAVEPRDRRYRFLNSGGYLGPCHVLRAFVADHRGDLSLRSDDQGYYGTHYVAGDGRILLDHECRIFQNLIGHAADADFEWLPDARRWRNRHTGATPFVLHGNGPAESRALLFDVLGPRCGV